MECVLLVAGAIAVGAALASRAATAPSPLPPQVAVPDPYLQAVLFRLPKMGSSGDPDQLWLGADCATSLRLSHNHTLWLFGDTLISG